MKSFVYFTHKTLQDGKSKAGANIIQRRTISRDKDNILYYFKQDKVLQKNSSLVSYII